MFDALFKSMGIDPAKFAADLASFKEMAQTHAAAIARIEANQRAMADHLGMVLPAHDEGK